MRSPFPGMDPYLEHTELWPAIHTRLIASLGDELAARVDPRYHIDVEQRLYVAGTEDLEWIGTGDVTAATRGRGRSGAARIAPRQSPLRIEIPMPDDVRERSLVIREIGTWRVVAVIEILSPSNKEPGPGRERFLRKRQEVLLSRAHLVEIDLLRGGRRMPARRVSAEYHYSILVSRSFERPDADLFPFTVRDPIPVFRLPLDPGQPEPEVDLAYVLAGVYERARYGLVIDYRGDPVPPLARSDATWARRRIRDAGRRREQS